MIPTRALRALRIIGSDTNDTDIGTVARKSMECIAGMSIVSARNNREKLVCNCVLILFSKYQFIDLENGDISY
jgi:hypothetical protein